MVACYEGPLFPFPERSGSMGASSSRSRPRCISAPRRSGEVGEPKNRDVDLFRFSSDRPFYVISSLPHYIHKKYEFHERVSVTARENVSFFGLLFGGLRCQVARAKKLEERRWDCHAGRAGRKASIQRSAAILGSLLRATIFCSAWSCSCSCSFGGPERHSPIGGVYTALHECLGVLIF